MAADLMPSSPATGKRDWRWREHIAIHPAAELFPLMPADELQKLAGDIKQNGMQVAPVFFRDEHGERLLDGRNRLDAAELAGDFRRGGPLQRFLSCAANRWVHEPPEDPYELVVSLNILRRHLTTAQKQELIDRLLSENPDRSDRQTAELAKVSPTTVGTRRQRLAAKGEIPKVTETVGRDGRIRTATPARKTIDKPGKTEVERVLGLSPAARAAVEAYAASTEVQTTLGRPAAMPPPTKAESAATPPTSGEQPQWQIELTQLRELIRRATEGHDRIRDRVLHLQEMYYDGKIEDGGPNWDRWACDRFAFNVQCLRFFTAWHPLSVQGLEQRKRDKPRRKAAAKTESADKPAPKPVIPAWCKPGKLQERAELLRQALAAAGSNGLHKYDDVSPLDVSDAASDRGFAAMAELTVPEETAPAVEIDDRIYLRQFAPGAQPVGNPPAIASAPLPH